MEKINELTNKNIVSADELEAFLEHVKQTNIQLKQAFIQLQKDKARKYLSEIENLKSRL
jgi:hypothetical protein